MNPSESPFPVAFGPAWAPPVNLPPVVGFYWDHMGVRQPATRMAGPPPVFPVTAAVGGGGVAPWTS